MYTVSDEECNREILQTGYMDYLPYAACVTLTSLGIYNKSMTPHLYIGDMTFMDNTENRPFRYGFNILLLKLNNILKLCPFTLQTLQNVYIEECTY